MYSNIAASPPSGHKTRQVWTPEEDRLLSEAVASETPKHGPISWHKVAAHLPGRNNKDCRKRWHYSIVNTIRKGTWTREEDQKLRAAVEAYGARWSKIAEAVGTRNGDQCWKRWYDCLDPRIDKSPWTPEEDARLLQQVAKHGRNWSDIVHKNFPNRTSLSAKNRYSILQRKQENASKSGSSQRSGAGSLASSPSPSPSVNLNVPYVPSSQATTPDPEYNPGWQITEAEVDDFLQQSFTTSEGWYSDGMGSSSHTPSPQMGADYEWSGNGTTWGSPAPSGFAPSPMHQAAGYVQQQSLQQEQMLHRMPMQAASASGYNMLGVYQSEYPAPPVQGSMYEQPMPDMSMMQQGGLEYLQPVYGNVQWQ